MLKLSTKAEIADAGAKARLAIRKLLPIVVAHRDSLVECHSQLGQTPRGMEPIPGTLDKNVEAEVRAMDRAIKAGRQCLAQL
jgi:hypothetical protein